MQNQNNKIYVGNLSYSTNEGELETLFSQYGEITNINLITDRETGRFRGFGFIEFSTPDQAEAALKLNGQTFQERSLKVNLAREQRSGGGNRRGGNRGSGRRWQ